MKKYLRLILPTPATWVSFFILPFVLSLYFLTSRYSDKFITTHGVDYVAIQDNVLANFFMSGELNEWISRFMDFAFWGVLACLGLLIFWAVSSVRTVIQNSVAVSEFANNSGTNWHQQTTILIGIKVITIIIVVYCILMIVTQLSMRLAFEVSNLMQQNSIAALLSFIGAFMAIIIAQAVAVASVRIFKLSKL